MSEGKNTSMDTATETETHDEDTGLVESKAEIIDPADLKFVGGFRRKMNRTLGKVLIAGGVGSAVGGGVGAVSQDAYRDWADYHPEAIVEALEKDEIQNEEAKSLLDRARRTLDKVKNWGAEKIAGTELAKQIKEMEERWLMALEVGDKVAFWLPFLITFLATVLMMKKGFEIKAKWTDNIDPEVKDHLLTLEYKINQIIYLTNNFSADQQMNQKLLDEIEQLKREFDDLKGGIEIDIEEDELDEDSEEREATLTAA